MRNPDQEVQQHIEALYAEKDHMSKEIYLLRETIKVLNILLVMLIITCIIKGIRITD